MARPRKYDGVVYRRTGTQTWWMRYWDGAGTRHEESTRTSDWKEAQKRLRERLQARDDNVLEIVRSGEHTTFREWATVFLDHHSKPPLRSAKTHESHQRAVKHLSRAIGSRTLTEISPGVIEGYLRARLLARFRERRARASSNRAFSNPRRCIRSSGCCDGC